MAIYNFVATGEGTDAAVVEPHGTAFVPASVVDGQVGFWSVDEGQYLDGSSLARTLLNSSYGSTAPLTAELVNQDVADPIRSVRPARFQVVQQRSSGPAYVTPIIRGADVKSIELKAYSAPVKASYLFENLTDQASGDTHELKFVVKGLPTDYGQVLNNYGDKGQLRTGEVINVVISGTFTAKDDLGAEAVVQINNSRLGFMATATYSAAGDDLTVTANAVGFDFDLVSQVETVEGTLHIPAGAKTEMAIGVGGADAVKYAEEKSLANWGYHNRIWFSNNVQPNVYAPTAIAAGAAGFDLCQIIASVDGYGGSIGKKGREDIVVNYWYDEAGTSAASTLDNALTGIDQEVTLGSAYKWEFNGGSVSVG